MHLHFQAIGEVYIVRVASDNGKAHSYLSAHLSPLEWTDTHGTGEKYTVLWLNQDHVVFYSYRTKMKYSYQCVVAMLSSVSFTSHVHNSWLKIRRTMAANWFPSRRSVKTMQMDGRSSHWALADCVHAACKMHEAWSWSNLSQPSTGKLSMLHYRDGWISVDGSLEWEMHAKDHPEIAFSHRRASKHIQDHTHFLA